MRTMAAGEQGQQTQRHQHEAEHRQDVGDDPDGRRECRRPLQGRLVRVRPDRWVQGEQHAGDGQGQGAEADPHDRTHVGTARAGAEARDGCRDAVEGPSTLAVLRPSVEPVPAASGRRRQ